MLSTTAETHASMPRAWLPSWVSVLAFVLVGLGLQACATNPTTGRSQFQALSIEEEIAIGTQGKPEMIKEYGGEVAKVELRQYITEVGMRLVATTAQDDQAILQLPWEFTLLDSPVINAFALPGGKVFMSRGLASKMTNEAQLAAVLGHEVGHVTARHVNDRFARQMGAQVGLGVLSILLGADVGGAGNLVGLALMSYDREQELESDALGMRYMARAGYDPLGTKQVMEILAREAGGRGGSEIMSTHPLPESRVKRAQQLLETEYAFTQGNSQFKLGEQEFAARFLSKLAAAYPEGRPENLREQMLATAVRGCVAGCEHCSKQSVADGPLARARADGHGVIHAFGVRPRLREGPVDPWWVLRW
jgi:predicted Zn-dependent protease